MAGKTSASKKDAKSAEEKTRELAQKIYEERMSTKEPGDALSDWVKAEAKLKKKKA
jgi:hypothetical protein